MMEEKKNNKSKERIFSIDQFRGALLFLNAVGYMLVAFTAILSNEFLDNMPSWWYVLPGVSIDDLFLPLFIFIIGLTVCTDFRKYAEKSGYGAAIKKYGIKYLILIGFGAVMMSGLSLFVEFFLGDFPFAGERAIDQILFILFAAFIPAFIVWATGKIIKRQKIEKYSLIIIRALWAAGGVISIIFLIASSVSVLVSGPRIENWDVFQTIGLAALLALPFVGLNKRNKLITACVFAVLLTVFYECGGFEALGNAIINGGFVGGFGWAVLVLLGGVFRDMFDGKKTWGFWTLSAALVIVPVVLSYGWFGLTLTAARRGATPVFVLFSAGLASAIWGIFSIVNKNFKPRYSFTQIWGGSPIFTYAVSAILATVFRTALSDVPLFAAIIISIVTVGSVYAVNHFLTKNTVHIKISA